MQGAQEVQTRMVFADRNLLTIAADMFRLTWLSGFIKGQITNTFPPKSAGYLAISSGSQGSRCLNRPWPDTRMQRLLKKYPPQGSVKG